MRVHLRWRMALLLSPITLWMPACGWPSQTPTSQQTSPAKLKDEIPPSQLSPVMEAHLLGLGYMEQFDYPDAVTEFRTVHKLAPGWIPGSINLAIALLNAAGKAKADSANPALDNNEEALKLLGEVLERDPDNLHAHFCRGLILERQGSLAQAHKDFQFVAERDPNDAHVWFKLGDTLTDPSDPDRPPFGPEQAKQLVELYSKALERNPYLVPAIFKLQSAYARIGERDQQRKWNELWQRLNPEKNAAAPGDESKSYGEMGRYSLITGPALPRDVPAGPLVPPRFERPEPLKVTLSQGERWVEEADFKGTQALYRRIRARFGAAVAAFDADGDGKTDLFLAAAILGPKGIRDALLLNRGEGQFEDATLRLGLPADRASLGVAAGDFDADRRIDLYLTGVGDNRLYQNLGSKGFKDVSLSAGVQADTPAVSLTARWLDLDQDGDLDLYVINFTGADHADEAFTGTTPLGLPNSAYRNDGKPSAVAGRPEDTLAPVATATDELPATEGLSVKFTTWPDAEPLIGGSQPHTAVAALDLDQDRDIDLMLVGDGMAPTAVLNDRLGRFHTASLQTSETSELVSGLLVTDVDKDGRPDLVALSATGRMTVWQNRAERTEHGTQLSFAPWPTDAQDWRSGVAADLDLDSFLDVVGLPTSSAAPIWARNEGQRLASRPLALAPQGDEPRPLQGLAVANLVGNPLPDLLLSSDGAAPRLAKNLGNSNHWIALDLSGRWLTDNKKHMRTNPEGLGTRIWLEGQGLQVTFDYTTPEASLGQSVGPLVLGLGKHESVTLVRLRWPDGVIQCELNRPADQVVSIPEFNRKESSCPVLFTWNGDRFVCIGDFLGGGGLGYLLAPDVYSEPDRDEAVAIAPGQLRADGDIYRLSVTEPMDEVAYIDRVVLDVVDRPPGIETAPDERFAPGGNRPTGELIAWRNTIEPTRATDQSGDDITEDLRVWDRRTADRFRLLRGWIGYAQEHAIVLDFGDRLSRFGPSDPLVLCLAGWVEYPFSQTNYAAATAGVSLRPPVLERQQDDGSWVILDQDPGYPAGMPRLSTLHLTGKLSGPRCVLRLRTNMECYWDRAFIAVRERESEVRVTAVPLLNAALAYRGYTREISPDGRDPLIYDYSFIDPAPLARLDGYLTRYGDVVPLLRADDDQLCLIGPGDEVRLEFDARSAPPLPNGWSRAYVLRTIGYCKDSDLFTATGDTIEPLPWRGMPHYPFGPEGKRPEDPPYRAYLREYQTRPAGAR
jgi:tetratricopeptide (TPR) repeat protein